MVSTGMLPETLWMANPKDIKSTVLLHSLHVSSHTLSVILTVVTAVTPQCLKNTEKKSLHILSTVTIFTNNLADAVANVG